MVRRIFAGALGFWGSEIVLYAWTRHELDIRLQTVLLPVSLLVSYFIVWRMERRKAGAGPSTAIFMLAGLWLLGTTAIMVGMTFLGAGLRNVGFVGALGSVLMGAIPIYTFIAATYDGSLIALFIASVMMPILHVIFERDRWIIPPRWG